MRYALAVLTHGDNEPLRATIDSFMANALPQPVAMLVHYDGGVTKVPPTTNCIIEISQAEKQQGFCGATAALWEMACWSHHDYDYVFWLEHDFRFTEPIQVASMAGVLTANPNLAQLSIMRQPVNQRERQAGGVLADHRQRGATFAEHGGWLPWLSHRAYFTTNPSLMRRGFMLSHRWPDDGLAECEGRMGAQLLGDGYYFGIVGDGSPGCEHVGRRTGKGY